LKHYTENCNQTTADGDILLTAYRKLPPSYPTVPLPTPYDLPFSHNSAKLAYHSALWPLKVIQGQRFSCSLKVHMPLPISD